MFVFCVQMFVLIRLIIWLDHARTDNNCSQADKDRVNYGSYQCLEDKREKVESDLKSVFSRRQNLQDNICSVLRSVSQSEEIYFFKFQNKCLKCISPAILLVCAWPLSCLPVTPRGRGSSYWRTSSQTSRRSSLPWSSWWDTGWTLTSQGSFQRIIIYIVLWNLNLDVSFYKFTVLYNVILPLKSWELHDLQNVQFGHKISWWQRLQGQIKWRVMLQVWCSPLFSSLSSHNHFCSRQNKSWKY